jgi:metal-responsive CopG/Arc/MetJ family transcriptional regulator
MEKQNVTVSLPRNLLKRAKIVAAKNETSLSELMRESLEEKVRESTGYEAARERQVRLLRKGFDLGTKGRITTSREDLHERR